MTGLPQITIASSDGGWLASCSCGAASWQQRRPQADRWAWDHRRACGAAAPQRGQEGSARGGAA